MLQLLLTKQRFFTYLFFPVLFLLNPPAIADELGSEEILANQLYIVYSGVDRNPNTFAFTTNIYLIKGYSDTVWVFGAGCGDKSSSGDSSDIKIYQKIHTGSELWDCTQNAIDDARVVDTVLTSHFGVTDKADVILQYVVPHGHVDHHNQEFLSAFVDSLGYTNLTAMDLFVHENDSMMAACSGLCCDTGDCDSKEDPYFGAPYLPPWESDYLSKFTALGDSSDVCNNIGLTFTSPSGDWAIKKAVDYANSGHTDGALNIDNMTNKIRLRGDNDADCDLPQGGSGWVEYLSHGFISEMAVEDGNWDLAVPKRFHLYDNFPNPFNPVTKIQYDLSENTHVNLAVYDLLGREVKRLVDGFESAGFKEAEWNARDNTGKPVRSGVYFYRLRTRSYSETRKMVLLK